MNDQRADAKLGVAILLLLLAPLVILKFIWELGDLSE